MPDTNHDDSEGQQMKVNCTDCTFSKVVNTNEELPAEVVVEHGQKTGHKLSVEPVENDST